MIRARERSKGLASLVIICNCFGLKRDAYYKYKHRTDRRLDIERKIIEIVKRGRKSFSKEGVRKLKISLKNEFDKATLKVGRDMLFNILRKHNMLITRKKLSYRTTNSLHRFYKYKNIIKDAMVNKPNQVWVSDITYIWTVKGFCYLALITDMHSRKIIVYDLSDSLEPSGFTRALKKTLYQAKNTENLIHNSDIGIQYCSNVFTQILKRNNSRISMTENNHCSENVIAECFNGILKDEFYLERPLIV